MLGRGRRARASDIIWAIWSPIAWALALVLMTAICAVALPLTLFVPFERFQTKLNPICGLAVHLSLSRLRKSFAPGYDVRRPSMYVQNHTSMLDAHVATASIRAPFCGLENASHLQVPGYGWLMRIANAIPVEKGAGRFRKIAEAITERISRGISVLVFPEAHRTLDGKVRPFKRGVFRIARDAGIPIVPLAVRGMFDVLPKGTFIARPGTLEVYMGPQFETKGLSDDEVDALADRVHEVISAFVERGERIADTEESVDSSAAPARTMSSA